MRRTPYLLPLLLVVAACSSAPTTDRPQVPDRPEVHRPEGVEPDGLSAMRDDIGGQRAAARERENALVVKPNALQTTSMDEPWYETAIGWVGRSVGQAASVWKLLGL
jgi:hypothetical protein